MAKYIKNAAGKYLYYSADAGTWLTATTAASTYSKALDYYTYKGSAGNDIIGYTGTAKMTLAGGAGDDIYYLWSPKATVYETAGGGVDTVHAYFSYQLPANVENLYSHGTNIYAYGNNLDNIIVGDSGNQTFWGGGGDDVMTGGGGHDTFIIDGGGGRVTVTDFSSDDTIRLYYYPFKTFNDVLSHAKQVGSDAVITVSDTSSVTLLNTSVKDLKANEFDLNISKTGMKMTFDDEFNSLSLNNGHNGGTWDPKFWYSGDKGGTITGDGELQWFVNPNYAATASANPFSIHDGVLTINAATASSSVADITGYQYTSGLLTTYSSFSQTYGYFEMRAQLPQDTGAWPAFWLLPKDGSWPPEIDILEAFGGQKNTYYGTVHSASTGTHTQESNTIYTQDTSGYHTYGLLWTKDTISWYYDGTEVASVATPADMHKDMYILVDLAVGGLAGTPSSSDFADGAQYNIDYIHAYSLTSSSLYV